MKRFNRCLLGLLTIVLAAMPAVGVGQIFLGPPEPGPSSLNWLTGAYGEATTSCDLDDPGNGVCSLVISNTAAGNENRADWRCLPFSLGPAAGGARPITFSFAYKLAERVEAKNNIHVQLRFFNATGTNFIDELVVQVGAHTGDSAMTGYRTLTFTGILASRKARTADIWIDANIFEPWVSGKARFDDFSVTTEPRSLDFKAGVIACVWIGVCALGVWLMYFWHQRRSAR